MQDYEDADCPMSEPFRAKIGITIFLACLFYQGFIARMIFAPLMPAIETDMGLSHAQAGGLFLMVLAKRWLIMFWRKPGPSK